ncbi:-hydroxytryptamine receptor 1E [Scomber scombrus]|uniref:-hydroxytryptamine receptor 1E n=2 Tax=Scomber scombrus TaxID=13677 RepID=A0AAV1PUG2_SCOSC
MGSQNSVDRCRVSHTFCVSDLSNSDLTTDKLNATIRMPSFETDLDGQDEKNQICTSRERKAAKILGLILGAFIVCWLPFFLKEVLVGLQVLQPSQFTSDFLTWLGYINSLINPLLYTSFNDDFKLAFKKILKRKEHA